MYEYMSEDCEVAVENVSYCILEEGVEDIVTEEIGKVKTDKSEHDFTVQTWKEDFCLIVEDKRFYVAKNILALISPVFERMFQGDFKEKDRNEMELPGKLSAVIEEFLKCLYPSVLKEVTIKNAFQIISLAEEYQVDALKEKCEDCFLSAVNETSSAENIFKMLNTATLYSLTPVLEKCIKLAAKKSLAELDDANEKAPIPLQTNCAIQRKMIEEMKAKQQEIEKRLDRSHVLYKYHRAEVECFKRLEHDDFLDFEGKSVYIKIENSKFNKRSISDHVCEEIYVGETLFNLKFERGTWFRVVISVEHEHFEQRVKINLVGNVVLFNGMEGKKNLCKKVKTEFDRHTRSFGGNLISETDLRNEGYIYNGEICVECNILALKMKNTVKGKVFRHVLL